jgi:DNA-binding response OmpR family regulator
MSDDRHTVLVVEDDPATRGFLADNLAADGFEPLLAETARVGLKLIETHQPDAAIVDVGLPDASGLELVEQVRASDGLKSRLDRGLPLIMLSGRASEVDRLRGFDRGADDYLVKPTASFFGARASGSRCRIGRHVSSTPATTSGLAAGTMIQRPASSAVMPSRASA